MWHLHVGPKDNPESSSDSSTEMFLEILLYLPEHMEYPTTSFLGIQKV
jgi:hypothetical protein